MLGIQFLAIQEPWWQDAVIPSIGVVCAVLVFYLGWILSSRRTKRLQPLPLPPRPLISSETGQDPFVGGVFGEKRAALRRQGNPIPVLISDATVTADPYYGWVIDRSMGGLCLTVETPVSVGTIISVRPTNAPDTAPWVQVEIRRCKEEGKSWELGCQFLKTPSWGVLLLFG
jgi:hypothetical protein